jgi:mRNA-degrading endonuclease RelE of RelBE toxin-antitoxin system
MSIDVSGLEKSLRKLKHSDPALFQAVQRKISQIARLDRTALKHFKNLRGDLSDHKRVHVGGFVLFFKLEGDTIIFDRLVSHDQAYG